MDTPNNPYTLNILSRDVPPSIPRYAGSRALANVASTANNHYKSCMCIMPGRYIDYKQDYTCILHFCYNRFYILKTHNTLRELIQIYKLTDIFRILEISTITNHVLTLINKVLLLSTVITTSTAAFVPWF